MKLSDELRAELVNYIHENKIRPVDLAQRTGITQATLSRIFAGKTSSISDETADRLCREMRLQISDMLNLSLGGKLSACAEDPGTYRAAFSVSPQLMRQISTIADSEGIDVDQYLQRLIRADMIRHGKG